MNFFDIAYSLGLWISAPVWLLKKKTREKVLTALNTRMGEVPACVSNAPAILIHAVSVGEINATKALIDQLRRDRPGLSFIVSTTTQTGYERGQSLYANIADVTLIRYPLDFSKAVNRVLDHLKPSLAILMELEIWPNFVLQCEKRRIPVVVANGRITEPSFRKYRKLGFVTRKMFGRVTRICAQDETYAKRFVELGTPRDRISIEGTMKFDTATVSDSIPGDAELAEQVGLRKGDDLIWVCGSTGPGEEEITIEAYRALKPQFPKLRLAIIPRHPPRFEEVAELIRSRGFSCTRRSEKIVGDANSIVLGDTMGELRKFYSLADVVFVGRSLVDLGHRQHGSDMIEPAAVAKPVVVGPFTTNFADAMLKFRAANAIIEVSSAEQLTAETRKLLANVAARQELGRKAQKVVIEQQGSTLRHAKIILAVLNATKI